MRRKLLTIAGILVLPCSTLLADFSYEETSTITGGAMASMMKVAGVFSKQAREPIHSTIALKGNQMMHRSANNGSVIDLDAQTITTIDFQKKTYSVMTFEEMKQMLEQMSEKMKQNDKGQMDFKVSADNTGKTQSVAGYDTKELILKMEMQATDQQSGQSGSMVITTDMWIAPEVPGYGEVRAFYRRMAEKIAWTPGGNMFMTRPDVGKGMAEVSKEMAKLDGIPVLRCMIMGAGGQPGAASTGGQAPAAACDQSNPQAQSQPKPSLGGALGGALGGRFGLGRNKSSQSDDQSAGQSGSANGSAGSGSLLEMKTEMSGFSSNAVDSAQLSVPAGFKKVESESRRGGR
jgi:hypothetical protein